MNPYLNDLLGYKKKKTRHLFRWKVVEAYRAERVQASELEETLGISMTELRRLNRNYFRYRLLPLLHPKHRHGPPLRSNYETRCRLCEDVGA